MNVFIKSIKRFMGWCPQMDTFKTPANEYKVGYENTGNIIQVSGSDPSPSNSTEGRDRSGYQENLLLIMLSLAWLFPVVYQLKLIPIMLVLSSAAMYYDAQNIHAGSNFQKETFLGNIVTWRPISWGALTFVGGIVIMAIYLFHRKEIYNSNN